MTFKVVASGYGLIEGPTFDSQGQFWFSDVTSGGVHRLNIDAGRIDLVIPRRRYVGGICAHRDGGIVMTGRDLTRVFNDGSSEILLVADEIQPETESRFLVFSDLCADKRGHVFVGVPRSADGGDDPTCGQVVRVLHPHDAHVCADDAALPNGITTSDDGTFLFHADSSGDRVLRYLVGADGLTLDTIMPVDAGDFPDGMASDVDGGVWVACYGTGRVVRLTADGSIDTVIEVPSTQVTSLCFGGSENTDLFIVTADHDEGLGGCILQTSTGHVGSRPPLATV